MFGEFLGGGGGGVFAIVKLQTVVVNFVALLYTIIFIYKNIIVY